MGLRIGIQLVVGFTFGVAKCRQSLMLYGRYGPWRMDFWYFNVFGGGRIYHFLKIFDWLSYLPIKIGLSIVSHYIDMPKNKDFIDTQ